MKQINWLTLKKIDLPLLGHQMKEAAIIFFYVTNVTFILLAIKAWKNGTALAPLILIPRDAVLLNAVYMGLVLFLYVRKGKRLI